ncbi:hypothetical protein DCAR_0416110 [Daucus carota subsp. sativus]|uniref:Uncharacterized protein n=1 Tax=Daucus carota subsp. sativus TaxID=79200 RepID=A0AAF0WWE6_DAUCS|nr:hypothetical protein DCAR_0416110 [Daucus carota subsp. sativus]
MSCIQNFDVMWNHPTQKPITKYFTLRDLWPSFENWSAYGAKTKVMVNREEVDQFFAPSLSAIQIFTNKPYESSVDDSMQIMITYCFVRSTRNRGNNISFPSLYSSHMNISLQSDDYYLKPYFEFAEKVSPYNRTPLFDTVENLSKSNPGLQTLTSTDLTPSSWMYPICQIPNIGIPIKDFEAAFLTFHTISSFYQDMNSSGVQSSPSISLPPFGCATYKVQGDIWFNHGHSDYGRLSHLNKAAESWIRQIGFEHHDFNFFTRQTGHHHVGAKPSAEPSAELYFPCVPNFSGFWP